MTGRRRVVAGLAAVAVGLLPGAIATVAALETTAAASPASGAAASLDGRSLAMPVAGVRPTDLRDTFLEGRPGHRHEALDIAAPTGTKVFAVDAGRLVKLFTSVRGGLTVYQFDAEGRLAFYYAHLDRYADGLREGMPLRRCDLLGYVGSSGNASTDAPHLHFAVFRLGPARQWWKGEPLDPYPALSGPSAGAACPP